jgi:hypothetical protein
MPGVFQQQIGAQALSHVAQLFVGNMGVTQGVRINLLIIQHLGRHPLSIHATIPAHLKAYV